MSNKNPFYVQFADGNVITTFHPEYHPEANILPKGEGKKLYIEQIKNNLIKLLENNNQVYCIIRHVSESGMSREISLHVIDDEKRLCDISYSASQIIGWNQGKSGGIKVSGCGMDMAFHTVYTLSSILYDGYGSILKSDIV